MHLAVLLSSALQSIILLAQQGGNGGAAAGVFGAGFLCVLVLFGIGSFIVWLYALIDAIKNPRLSDQQRLIWVLVIVFTHFIGALIYLIVGKNA